MTEAELKAKFPNASAAFIKANTNEKDIPNNTPVSLAKPERCPQRRPLAKGKGTEEPSIYFLVRYESRRQRLTDDENAYTKPITDLLRYAGIIHDDRPQVCKVIVWQKKVERKEDESVLVEVFEVSVEEWSRLRELEKYAAVDATKTEAYA